MREKLLLKRGKRYSCFLVYAVCGKFSCMGCTYDVPWDMGTGLYYACIDLWCNSVIRVLPADCAG